MSFDLDDLKDLKTVEQIGARLHRRTRLLLNECELLASIIAALRRKDAEVSRLLTAVKRINTTLEEAGYHTRIPQEPPAGKDNSV